MYLVTGTRGDLALSASYLTRFTPHPDACHDTAAKSMFRYLARTCSLSSECKLSATLLPLSILVFSDCGYTSFHDTCHSESGYTIMLNGYGIS